LLNCVSFRIVVFGGRKPLPPTASSKSSKASMPKFSSPTTMTSSSSTAGDVHWNGMRLICTRRFVRRNRLRCRWSMQNVASNNDISTGIQPIKASPVPIDPPWANTPAGLVSSSSWSSTAKGLLVAAKREGCHSMPCACFQAVDCC